MTDQNAAAEAGAAQPLVRFEGVVKRFGDQAAVDGVSLDIEAGEFFALLGPSGCGKTTLMRLLAGFETPDVGRVLLDGEDLAGSPPHKRPVNMMFQSYALFPHLSVIDNIAYGLRQEGMAKPEREARVAEMLALVQLEAFGARKPAQLSGGQKQRVALARALAKRPRMLLLDEPLAALDKKLREETQGELKRIQKALGTTFLMVTHDQDEAMVLADRIGVMQAGRIVQVGAPRDIYEAPASRYVADFLGDVNLFEARVMAVDGLQVGLSASEAPGSFQVQVDEAPALGLTVWLAVRPEKLRLSLDAPAAGAADALAANSLAGVVADLSYTGDWTNLSIALPDGRRVRASRANASRRVERPIGAGDAVWISFETDAGVLLTQ